jgi:hypothetical protein
LRKTPFKNNGVRGVSMGFFNKIFGEKKEEEIIEIPEGTLGVSVEEFLKRSNLKIEFKKEFDKDGNPFFIGTYDGFARITLFGDEANIKAGLFSSRTTGKFIYQSLSQTAAEDFIKGLILNNYKEAQVFIRKNRDVTADQEFGPIVIGNLPEEENVSSWTIQVIAENVDMGALIRGVVEKPLTTKDLNIADKAAEAETGRSMYKLNRSYEELTRKFDEVMDFEYKQGNGSDIYIGKNSLALLVLVGEKKNIEQAELSLKAVDNDEGRDFYNKAIGIFIENIFQTGRKEVTEFVMEALDDGGASHHFGHLIFTVTIDEKIRKFHVHPDWDMANSFV